MKQRTMGRFGCVAAAVFAAVVFAVSAAWAGESGVTEFCNPLDVRIADPAILQTESPAAKHRYYLSGTGISRHVSDDLVHWRRAGDYISLNAGKQRLKGVWGCEVFEAAPNRFLLVFAAMLDSVDGREICLAEADSPDGEFRPLAYPLWADGDAWIGPTLFRDDDGAVYLFLTNDSKDKHKGRAQIFGARLKPNLRELDGPPVFLFEPSQPWELKWQEGVAVVKHKGAYYMTWSSRVYAKPPYCVGVAAATSPLGPYTKSKNNPLLAQQKTDPQFLGHTGPGSSNFVRSPDGRELFICYHTHISSLFGGPRQLNLDRVVFAPDGANPDRMTIPSGVSLAPQPYPSGSPAGPRAQSDEFDGDALDARIWRDVCGENATLYSQDGHGALRVELSAGGFAGKENTPQNVFLQDAPEGPYTIATRVGLDARQPGEQAFLIVWQDSENYVSLATTSDGRAKLAANSEINEALSTATVDNDAGATVCLQIRHTPPSRYEFFYSSDAKSWSPVGKAVERQLLEPKMGLGGALGQSKRKGVVAEFDYFRVSRTP